MIAQRTPDVFIILMIHIRVSVWRDLKILKDLKLLKEGLEGIAEVSI